MGGIQTYLWELWRRLPAGEATVLTTPHAGAPAFDAAQPFRVVRTRAPVLLPTPGLTRRIRALATEVGAGLVVLDPALPLGLLGPHLGRPYAVVVHGAEVSVPARLPGLGALLRRVLAGASHVIAAGEWVREECERLLGRRLDATVVPPGVDPDRFHPPAPAGRARARAAAGVEPVAQLVVSLSRLVPRKGMDVLVAAASLLARDHPDLVVVIAGTGRDRDRLARLVRHTGAPVRLVGAVSEDDKISLLGAADVFALPCRRRWLGLEQEGFGIVFLEAAACGVPQVAGASGGAAEAVSQGRTGVVVRRPDDPVAVASALGALLDDPGARRSMGTAARARVEAEFGYDHLAARLGAALRERA